MTLLLGAGILTEVALSFLGFGIRPPDISLGSLISEYQGALTTRPWLFIWPGVFVIIIVLCIQFIGDGLRDAFDPRQKRIPKQKDLQDRRRHGRIGDGQVLIRTAAGRSVRAAVLRRSARPGRPGSIGDDVPGHRRPVELQSGLSRWPASRSASHWPRIANAA